MSDILEYKGYRGSVEYSADDRVFHGKVLGIRSYITYEGADANKIEKDFRDSVDFYLDVCEKQGRKPEKEYTGTFQVRVSPETHRKLVQIAEESGKKLNTVVSEALDSLTNAS